MSSQAKMYRGSGACLRRRSGPTGVHCARGAQLAHTRAAMRYCHLRARGVSPPHLGSDQLGNCSLDDASVRKRYAEWCGITPGDSTDATSESAFIQAPTAWRLLAGVAGGRVRAGQRVGLVNARDRAIGATLGAAYTQRRVHVAYGYTTRHHLKRRRACRPLAARNEGRDAKTLRT
jgi:hypothetical protein